MEAIEGEVVDPGKVIICEPGKAESARAQMDRRHEYGGLVRESDTCPAGKLVVIDTDRIKANLDTELPPFQVETPSLDQWARARWIYGATLTMPRSFGPITSC